MFLVSVVVGVLALVLLLPTISDVVTLLFGRRKTIPPATAPQIPRFLILVPAHNESLLIESCVRSLCALDFPADRRRIVVIADNCTDDTGIKAVSAGAECLVRFDRVNRGKPHAIAWALEELSASSFEMLVVVDADTVIDPRFLREVARVGPLRDIAVQGYHGVSNPRENALTRMSTVFAAARYQFAFPLKQRAGLNVPMMGNGMCIGAAVLAKHGWNAFSICEDWELYLKLTDAGVPILVAPKARVYSQEAQSLQQSTTQRQRWTAGKWMVLRASLPALIGNHRLRWQQKLDMLAELTAPGPAVHLGVVILLGTAILAMHAPAAELLAAVLAFSVLRIALYTAAAIRSEPKPLQTCAAFLYLPFYTLWRLGIQVSALSMVGNKPWIRTERHAVAEEP